MNKEDIVFINQLCERFPEKKLSARFNHYLGFSAAKRLKEAQEDLAGLKRAGWVRIGVPDVAMQTVAEHQKAMVYLISTLPNLGKNIDKKKSQRLAAFHDYAEAIVGDFTLVDGLPKVEKNKLEGIAVNLLFKDTPKLHEGWIEFEQGITKEAYVARDVDQLEMLAHALYLEENYPDLKPKLAPFWDYAETRLRTDIGAQLFKEFEDQKAQMGLTVSPVYAKMEAYYTREKSSKFSMA